MRQKGKNRPHVRLASNVPYVLEERQKRSKYKLVWDFISRHGTQVKQYYALLWRCQNLSHFHFCYTSNRGRQKFGNEMINEKITLILCLQKWCIWSQQQRSFGGQSCKLFNWVLSDSCMKCLFRGVALNQLQPAGFLTAETSRPYSLIFAIGTVLNIPTINIRLWLHLVWFPAKSEFNKYPIT